MVPSLLSVHIGSSLDTQPVPFLSSFLIYCYIAVIILCPVLKIPPKYRSFQPGPAPDPYSKLCIFQIPQTAASKRQVNPACVGYLPPLTSIRCYSPLSLKPFNSSQRSHKVCGEEKRQGLETRKIPS